MPRSWRASERGSLRPPPGGRSELPRTSRRGVGIVLAFALWVLAIAFIYALVQSQAQTGALGAVARVAFLRTIVAAGEAALEETGFMLRNRPAGRTAFTQGLKQPGASGVVYDPLVTRDLYQDTSNSGGGGGQVSIEPVRLTVVAQSTDPTSTDPWLIDLAVRARISLPGGVGPPFSRQIRRRYAAQVRRVIETVGPRKGQVLYTEVSIVQDPIFEVIEP